MSLEDIYRQVDKMIAPEMVAARLVHLIFSSHHREACKSYSDTIKSLAGYQKILSNNRWYGDLSPEEAESMRWVVSKLNKDLIEAKEMRRALRPMVHGYKHLLDVCPDMHGVNISRYDYKGLVLPSAA